MGIFLGLLTDWGGGAKRPPVSKICHTYPTMMKLGTLTTYLNKIQKYMNHVTHHLSPADTKQHYFTGNQQILLYQEIQL